MFFIDILGVLELVYYFALLYIISYYCILLRIIIYHFVLFYIISYYFMRFLKVMYNLGITLRNFWYINNTYLTHFLYIRYASSCDIYNLGIIYILSFALESVNMNSVPTPSVLMTLIFSLCVLRISLTIESPSPVPFLSLPRDKSDL